LSLINFDVKISPAELDLGVAMSPEALTVSLRRANLGFDVQPSTGTIVGGALSGALIGAFTGAGLGALVGGGAGVGMVYAVAKLIQEGLSSAVNDKIGGEFPKPVPFGQTLGYSVELGDLGVTVSATLASVELSSFDGMLLASGTVRVS